MVDINVNKLSEALNTKADIDLNNTGVFSTVGGGKPRFFHFRRRERERSYVGGFCFWADYRNKEFNPT